jgi:hypothetical protein
VTIHRLCEVVKRDRMRSVRSGNAHAKESFAFDIKSGGTASLFILPCEFNEFKWHNDTLHLADALTTADKHVNVQLLTAQYSQWFNTKCRFIDFAHCALRDQDVQVLCNTLHGAKQLVYLNLRMNHILIDGAKAVCELLTNPNCQIKWLNLGGRGRSNPAQEPFNYFTPAFGGDLRNMLEANERLTWLDVSGVGIGDAGAEAFSSVLKGDTCKLKYLGLSRNAIQEHGLVALMDALKTNSVLEGLELDSSLIENGSPVAEMILSNACLKHLSLVENLFGNDGLRGISEALLSNTSLTSVTFGTNLITEMDPDHTFGTFIAKSSHIKRLELLHFIQFDPTANQVFTAIRSNSVIEVLDLSFSSFDDDSAYILSKSLENGLSNLQVLLLVVVDVISDAGIASILAGVARRKHSTLMELSVYGSPFGALSSKWMKEILQITPSLETLQMGENKSNGDSILTNVFDVSFSSVTNLRVLHLISAIGNRGAVQLSAFLKGNSSLEILDLRGCSLDDGLSSMVLTSLIPHPNLRSVNLDSSSLQEKAQGSLIALLKTNVVLDTFSALDPQPSANLLQGDTNRVLAALERNFSLCFFKVEMVNKELIQQICLRNQVLRCLFCKELVLKKFHQYHLFEPRIFGIMIEMCLMPQNSYHLLPDVPFMKQEKISLDSEVHQEIADDTPTKKCLIS